MLRLLCTIIFALFVHAGNASAPFVKPVKAPLTLKMDTASVNVRHLDTAAITAHSKQPEFQYRDDIDTTPSWWDRFWRWFWNLFKPIKFGKHDMSPFLRALLYFLQYLLLAAGLAAVVFLVLKLMGIDMLGIFRRKSMSANLPFTESLENIHDINFDDEIERAVSQHNYRLAVRMLYLKCLKQLSDANLIKWQIDKTNSTYIDELTNADQRRLFRSLTLQFEYVWYGEFAIDGQTFKNINTVFQDFNKGIA
ncbi:hypothetical protein SAMN05428975_4107 [Mucilaginibacter sp. OK268]|jgi:hypothetical protein|uniref:DUF4129 domain-containing protein n=1 Tax=Mucilaginibacter sp. OK268 TaxID=1881048 RepID=UPI000881DFD9|nr:DUF4129 domain-containing protein [Mucilaginibacter sp. OK268]SDP95349.1 hypothetical protein SAMN05428975_4107 [Mucilaginibacter sp. OK268]